MPYTARSIENGGTITDAFGSTEIVENEGGGQANLPKPGSVAEIRRIPRLPTNVDGGEANGERVFRLEFPLDIDAASLPLAGPSLALSNAQTVPTRVISVLIVDDVAMNREIAGSILRAAGYQVTCVAGGAEAIAAIKAREFDVVLMDVRMPVMDGLEATRHIRGLQGRRGLVPIVALTAQDFPEHIEECRQAGMNGHVSKPFDPDKLAAAVVRATLVGSAQDNPREPVFTTVSTSASIARGVGSELRVIDLEMFKRTASFLVPKAVAAYLRKIATLAKALLAMLDGPDVPEWTEDEFAGAAHVVAGTAGMFGFERLTVASRQFERATECCMSDAPPLAEALSAAIKATLPEIRSRTVEAVYRDMEPSI
jgi:CheY-like chemotaxis protein